MRHDGRQTDELRPITVQRNFTGAVPGSVLIKAGRTTVLCTASIDNDLPPWMKREPNPKGWVTAEYNMLPGSTPRASSVSEQKSTAAPTRFNGSSAAACERWSISTRSVRGWSRSIAMCSKRTAARAR